MLAGKTDIPNYNNLKSDKKNDALVEKGEKKALKGKKKN